MPTYQYRCADCGRELEVVQKFTDASLTECPTCTGDLRKVFSAVGVVFKGSGFYRTDSRSGSSSSSKSSPSSTSSPSPSSASSSSSESSGSSTSSSTSDSSTTKATSGASSTS